MLIGGGWITLWAAGGSSTVAPAPHASTASASEPAAFGRASRNHQGASGHPAAGGRPIAGRSGSARRSAGGNKKAIRADRRPNRETRRPAAIDRQHAGAHDPRGWATIRSAAEITLRPVSLGCPAVTLGRLVLLMSDQDDWDFAGDDDAKMTIRAAVRYLLKGAPAATAAISCRRSSRSCAKPRTTHHPTSRIPSTTSCRADSLSRL